MRAKIFVGPMNTGKTRVARMIRDHVGRDKTLFIYGRTIDLDNDAFPFRGIDENIELIIIDDCPKDFNYQYFYNVERPKNPRDLKFILRCNMQGEGIETFKIPQIIFTALEIDEDLVNSGVSFTRRFEVIRFPLNRNL